MFGALDGLEFSSRVFTYEGPFGVGYLTAGFMPGEERDSLLYEIKAGKIRKMADRRRRECAGALGSSYPGRLHRKGRKAFASSQRCRNWRGESRHLCFSEEKWPIARLYRHYQPGLRRSGRRNRAQCHRRWSPGSPVFTLRGGGGCRN